MISCVEIQTEGANGGLSQARHQFFFLNNYLTIQWLWEIINSINSWVAIKKMFSQIFTDYKDEIYADDLQEGWKFIGRKKVRHPSY